MRPRKLLLSNVIAAILVVAAPMAAQAQPWSGLLSPLRATDWTTAGVVGGIPSRTTICATLNPGATGSQINTAITNCPVGQVVFLSAGSYTINDVGLRLLKSGVTMRGAGANQTKLRLNAGTSCCGLGANAAIVMGDPAAGCPGCGAAGGSDPAHTATWTATNYNQGQTVITLSTVSGLNVGDMLYLDQLDDTSDGYPATGDIVACAVQAQYCSNQGGTGLYRRANRSSVQVVTVTAINGSVVTFTPGLHAPNWRAAKTPGAYWNDTNATGIGLEDLSVDWSGLSGGQFILIKNVTNSWVLGVREITLYNSASGGAPHFAIFMASHLTIRSNYGYGSLVNGLDRYYINAAVTSDNLIENNICHHQPSCFLPNGPGSGDVYAYNYVNDQFFSPAGTQPHDGVTYQTLFEGNNWASVLGDATHSTHFFLTFFRNQHDGYVHNPSTTVDTAYALLTNNRFYNLVGNVIGHAHYTTYQALLTGNDNAVYSLGWIGNNSGTPVLSDTNVKRTLFRWMNWDSVTSTNDNGTNDQTGTRACTASTPPCTESEVPSGITNYANPVPASQVLPASMYLSAKPAWFGSVPWPPIGPDVSNGNITTATGGHANKIPARLCYENTPIDSAYGSANVLLFNRTTCYPQGGASSPTAPTNLRIIP